MRVEWARLTDTPVIELSLLTRHLAVFRSRSYSQSRARRSDTFFVRFQFPRIYHKYRETSKLTTGHGGDPRKPLPVQVRKAPTPGHFPNATLPHHTTPHLILTHPQPMPTPWPPCGHPYPTSTNNRVVCIIGFVSSLPLFSIQTQAALGSQHNPRAR